MRIYKYIGESDKYYTNNKIYIMNKYYYIEDDEKFFIDVSYCNDDYLWKRIFVKIISKLEKI